MADKQDEGKISLRIAFVGADDVGIQMANQFVVQVDEGELFLVIGQLAPPLFLGSEEDQLAQARAIPFVPVKVLGRYSVPLDKAKQLRDLLDRQIAVTTEQRKGDQG